MVAVHSALELLDDVPGGRRQLLGQRAFLAKGSAVGVSVMLEGAGDNAHGSSGLPGEIRDGSDCLAGQRLFIKAALAGNDEIGRGDLFRKPQCCGHMGAAGQDAHVFV